MKLQKSKKANINYLAKVIKIDSFSEHPNAERLKIAHIDGYQIAVAVDENPGLFIYFPTGCTINPSILSYLNLYRCKEINNNPEYTGFFEKNGRVKTIKLRGLPSEGFLLPFNALQLYVLSNLNVELPIQENGLEFDEIEHDGKTIWVNKKYVVETYIHPYDRRNKRNKNLKKFNKVIEGQFRFHYDTVIIKKCPYVINPYDYIHITEKIHGTSGISAYVLCKQKMNWMQKIIHWLTGKEYIAYDYLYASRTVVKNASGDINRGGFYGEDIWGEADKVLRPYLIPGMTLYYEIVGYLPNGKFIQKNYDYGCIPPKKTGEIDGHNVIEYSEGIQFKVVIYRITLTNVRGDVHEFSPREVQQWCLSRGLRVVNELYYGLAKDLYDIPIDENWSNAFIEHLANDSDRFSMELDSPTCNNKVPNEGIVIKIDNMKSEAFKLKCFRFLDKEQKELDDGISNIEDDQ